MDWLAILFYLFSTMLTKSLCSPITKSDDNLETDNEHSRKLLGSSVVTSVSVIMEHGNGTKTYITDPGDPFMGRPDYVGSPVSLMSPDRYEFYSFDEDGELVKKLMTLEQIQSIIAGGDELKSEETALPVIYYHHPLIDNTHQSEGVQKVVQNVQNVLKGELESSKIYNKKPPVIDNMPPHGPWNNILPGLFGSDIDYKIEEVTIKKPQIKPSSHPTRPTNVLYTSSYPPNEAFYSKPAVTASTTTYKPSYSGGQYITMSSNKITKRPISTTDVSSVIPISKPSKYSAHYSTIAPGLRPHPQPSDFIDQPVKSPIKKPTLATKLTTLFTTTINTPTTKRTFTTTSRNSTTTKKVTSTTLKPSTTKRVVTTTSLKPSTTKKTITKIPIKIELVSTISPALEQESTQQIITNIPIKYTTLSKLKLTQTTPKINEQGSTTTKIHPSTSTSKYSTTKKTPSGIPTIIHYLPIQSSVPFPSRTTISSTSRPTVTSKLTTDKSTIALQSLKTSPTIPFTVSNQFTTKRDIINNDEEINFPKLTTFTSFSQHYKSTTTPKHYHTTSESSKTSTVNNLITERTTKKNNEEDLTSESQVITASSIQLSEEMTHNTTSATKPSTHLPNLTTTTTEKLALKSDIPQLQLSDDISEASATIINSLANSIPSLLSLKTNDITEKIPTTIITTELMSESTPSATTEVDEIETEISSTDENEEFSTTENTETTPNYHLTSTTTEPETTTISDSALFSDELLREGISAVASLLLNDTVKFTKQEEATTVIYSTTYASTVFADKTTQEFNADTTTTFQESTTDSFMEMRQSDDIHINDTVQTTESPTTLINTEISNSKDRVTTVRSNFKSAMKSELRLEDKIPLKESKLNPDKEVSLEDKFSLHKTKLDIMNNTENNSQIEKNNKNITEAFTTESEKSVSKTTENKFGKRPGTYGYHTTQSNSGHYPPSAIELHPAPHESMGLEASVAFLNEDLRKFADLCNELAFKLWSAISANSLVSSRSLVMSPFASTSILAMVFLGARGPTSGQMNDILKLDDMVTFNPHQVMKNVTESVINSKNVGVVTAAFVRELYSDKVKGKILDFFKDRAQQYYDGHVEEVNFNAIGDIVRRRTNLLIKRQTLGKVPEYLRSSNLNMRPPLAAFTANIFQTDCDDASIDGRDGEMYFVVRPSTRQRRLVPVPAAVWRGGFLAGYEPSLDATAVALGAESVVSTVLILPGQQGQVAPGDGLARLEQRLIETNFRRGSWTRLLRSLLPRPGLELQVPRFFHRSVLNITKPLQRMGLRDIFNNKADLRGLNGVANDLHLSDIVQVNTFSTCGEEKVGTRHHTETFPTSPFRGSRSEQFANVGGVKRVERDVWRNVRGSAIVGVMGRLSENPRLRFDRPFLYMVRHNPTGIILHMGRFNPRLLP